MAHRRMNTPNPLVPKGSLLEQQKSKGKSNLFIAVFTILAIHVILFSGLLMQGCRRAKPDAESLDTTLTNAVPAEALNSSNMPLPGPSTNDYYAASPTSAPAMTPTAVMTPSNNLQPYVTAPVADAGLAPAGETKSYTVVNNDSFYKIAKANGVSLSALVKANPGVDSRKLKVGQTLQIPAPVAKSEVGGTVSATPGVGAETAVKPAAAKTYTVKAGDTLTKVARVNGLKVKALRDANKLKTDRLIVGQKLKIPTHKATTAAAPAESPIAAPTGVVAAPMPLAPASPTNRM